MSFFGQANDLLQQFAQGAVSVPELKDYTHASKTFESNGYALTPKFKFLFHVFFNINTAEIPQLRAAYGSGEISTIGLMVKSIDLPKFKIDTQTMNQYNRKRVVQSKIRYEPSRITFHDDQSDMIRNMWYNYYTYYYKDPSQQYQGVSATSGTIGQLQTLSNGFNYNTSDIYSPTRLSADWGYIGESYSDGTNRGTNTTGKPSFFRDITIYGLNQKKYAAWTLINPVITQWNSDTFDYNEGAGTLQNDVTIEYETVKYYSGAVGGAKPSNSVAGFADPANYDTIPSGITRPGGTQSVFGQGGLIDAAIGTTQDLQALASGQGGLQNVIGAVQTAGTAYNTFKGASIGNIFNADVKQQARNISLYSLPGWVNKGVNATNGMIFPKAPTVGPGTGRINGGGAY
jgi:hypothetical protein